MPTRGINYDDLEFLLFEEIHSLLSDLNWVSLFLVTEKRTLDLGCIHLKLLEGSCTEGISTHQADPPSFLHVVVSELGTRGGLTRPL